MASLTVFPALIWRELDSTPDSTALVYVGRCSYRTLLKYFHLIFVIDRKTNVFFTSPNKTFLYIFMCYIVSWCLFLLTLFEYRDLLVYGVAIFLIVTVSMEA